MASDSFKVKNSINLQPTVAPVSPQEGDIFQNDSTGNLEHHDGTSFDVILDDSNTVTVTNKSMDGASNTFTNLPSGSFAAVPADANNFLVRDGSGNIVSNTKAVPAGVVVGTTDTQTLSNKTLATPTVTGSLEADAVTNADIATSNTASTVNIGTGSGANVINIGGATSTINMTGTVNNQNVTNLNVTDKLITINDGGAVASGGGSGIEIEENGVITGYNQTSGDRNSWEFKAPNQTGVVSLSPGASNDTVTLVAAIQVLTNKVIDAAVNTLSNITNTAISAAAAISRSKIAAGAADHVIINNASGVLSSEATLAIGRGGTGEATAAAGFYALSPTTTKGDLIVNDGSLNVRQAVGADGFVLTADSTQTSGIKWAASGSGAQLKIKARKSSNQNIPSASTTEIIFDTEDEDSASAYNPVTGVFTVPTGYAGFYIITATIDLNNSSVVGQRTLFVNKTGTDVQVLRYDATPLVTTLVYTGLTGLQLADNDTVTIRLLQNSGGNQGVGGSGNDYNHLTITRYGD